MRSTIAILTCLISYCFLNTLSLPFSEGFHLQACQCERSTRHCIAQNETKPIELGQFHFCLVVHENENDLIYHNVTIQGVQKMTLTQPPLHISAKMIEDYQPNVMTSLSELGKDRVVITSHTVSAFHDKKLAYNIESGQLYPIEARGKALLQFYDSLSSGYMQKEVPFVIKLGVIRNKPAQVSVQLEVHQMKDYSVERIE